MNCYHHLTINERESILIGLRDGKTLSKIAAKLGRSRSTITRELQRNGVVPKTYRATTAEKNYQQRRKKCIRPTKLSDPDAAAKVTMLLNQYWSPEQISARLEHEKNALQVSFKTIYRSIENGVLEPGLQKMLRLKKNPRYGIHKTSRYGHLTIDYTIHDRPKSIKGRKRLGHWESDTLRGRNGTGVIATHVDRKSRLLVACKMPNRTKAALNLATIEAFQVFPRNRRLTFTVDHGKEFAGHRELSTALSCKVYFCDPMSPGQRGTNENTNGLLRQFFPKLTSFADVTQHDVDDVAKLLNRRPRKCLGWKTPEEVFFRKLLHLT